MTKSVFILVGESGSGKSTYANQLTRQFIPSAIVSADRFFTDDEGRYNFDPAKLSEAHDQCLREFIYLCVDGTTNVIVDNTNTTATEIIPYMRISLSFGFDPLICFMQTPVKRCVERNIHKVPEHTILAQNKRINSLAREIPLFIVRRTRMFNVHSTGNMSFEAMERAS